MGEGKAYRGVADGSIGRERRLGGTRIQNRGPIAKLECDMSTKQAVRRHQEVHEGLNSGNLLSWLQKAAGRDGGPAGRGPTQPGNELWINTHRRHSSCRKLLRGAPSVQAGTQLLLLLLLRLRLS